MRYAHIIEQVYHRPWLITAAGWNSIHVLVQSKLTGNKSLLGPVKSVGKRRVGDDDDDDFDWGAFAPPRHDYSVQDGIAIIPVYGVIGKGLSKFEKSCGACGVEDVTEMLHQAIIDPNVKAVIFDVNSPGGTVSGIPELSDRIALAAQQKPCFAFTDELMASAAYWISAGCTAVYCTPSADIGSIGVYLPFFDYSAALAEEGVTVELIKAGKLKGTAYPGTSLSKEGRAYLQEGVDDIYNLFTGFVTAHRDGVKTETMQGQTFIAEKARAAGLVDEIVPDFQRCFAEVKSLISQN